MDSTSFMMWITHPATLITVTVPFLVFLVGFAVGVGGRGVWMQSTLLATLLTPPLIWMSFAGPGGLHVIPLGVVVFSGLFLYGYFQFKSDWLAGVFGAWLSTIGPDTYGAWNMRHADFMWYRGIGGYGFSDTLFIVIVISVASFYLCDKIYTLKTKAKSR